MRAVRVEDHGPGPWHTVKRALVLAGGGVAGIAWELGVLRGIQDIDPGLGSSLAAADVIVGGATTAEEMRRRIGALALATPTVEESVRRGAIAARLPVPTWPGRVVLLPAVEAESGELMVFTPESGVALVDAVAASCAVPGIWPPVTIDGHRYIDGGVRSATNADLAAGCDRVLVITPMSADTPPPWGDLDHEIELLQPADAQVVYADAASLAAFGTNPLSPATRGPSAHAGREIGQARAADVARFWRGAGEG